MKFLLRHTRFKLLLFVLCLSFAANSQAESVEKAASRLQERYDTIQSLSFDFIQNTRGQLTGRPKTGRGTAVFVKDKGPGKMRWNYSDPDKQVLVSDGKHFSMYFESLHQMIVTPAESLQQDLTYSFFTGSGNLIEDFTISTADHSITSPEKQTTVIKLTPKAKQTQVASIHLWFTDDSLIRRIEILDQFDTLTILNFSNLLIDTIDPADTKIMSQLFVFIPPEGTEIIKQ